MPKYSVFRYSFGLQPPVVSIQWHWNQFPALPNAPCSTTLHRAMASRETLETAVDPALTPATASLGERDGEIWAAVKRFRLRIVEGSQAGCTFDSGEDRLQIGSHPMNNVHLNERTVSRFHCEVCVEEKGRAWVSDLGSRNGTKVDGVRVREAELVDGSVLQVGKTRLRFEALGERNQLLISASARFGALVGVSVAARSCFCSPRARGSDGRHGIARG